MFFPFYLTFPSIIIIEKGCDIKLSRKILIDIKEHVTDKNYMDSWKIYALKYKHNKSASEYKCCDIHLPDEDINKILRSYQETFYKKYNNQEPDDDQSIEVEDYTSYESGRVISKLSTHNDLVKDVWQQLRVSIQESDDSISLSDFSSNAYLLVGSYKNEKIYFITKKSVCHHYKKPVYHMISPHNNTLTPVKNAIYSFSNDFDLLVWNSTMYLFGMKGEMIFNLERSYRKVCKKHIQEIANANLICDTENFQKIAESGFNPRRFLTFDATTFAQVQTEMGKNIIKQECQIPIQSSGQYDLSNTNHAEIFIKIICGKIKQDLFSHQLFDVPKSKPL